MQIRKILRSRLFGCAALVFSLAGCGPTSPAGGPEGAQPQATAPALKPGAAEPASTAQMTASATPAHTPGQKRVRALIQQVEQAYARGNADYRKGKLPEAKVEFDRAVDLMLSSGLDIRNDAELQDEFNRIVDGVNGLEMEALKQGNGFVSKEEPTPGEAASEVTFAANPTIVAKAQADLATTKSDLPLVVNDYVATYINFFSNTERGHNTLLHSFERAGRYKAMIERVMAEEGVPQDLIYLAVAESGFQPRARNSQSGAGGMWQFMPQGNYGLVRNQYVDERFDPEKSTRAYARYMKFIHNQLGDWYLAMAGYNWGAGNVQRAVEKTGYADFWELYRRHNLPAETQNYVPQILAAIIIANHPAQYGFNDITLDPPVLTDTATINYQVDLNLVSDLVGAPEEELVALNPSLLRAVTPPDTSFDLHLPAGTAAIFEQRIAQIPEDKRDEWRYHRVAPGDTLESVARAYRASVDELAAANQLGGSASLDGVEGLVVPTHPVSAPPASALAHTVRRGETLVTIADRFGVSLSDLRRWNGISGIHVRPGSRLRVSDPASTPDRAVSVHRYGSSRSRASSRNTARAAGREASSTAAGARKRHASPEAGSRRGRRSSAAGKKYAHGSSAAGNRHTHSSSAAESGRAHSSGRTAGEKKSRTKSARKSTAHRR
jgi:membrane-bound lytic murein transglycosylase D